jgi:hypothetical protein
MMSEPKKNKRITGVKWGSPDGYTSGMFAKRIEPDPDKPSPLFWLWEKEEGLFFINSSDTTLRTLSATIGGCETCDDEVATVNNAKGYSYKDVQQNEAVKIEKFCPIDDSDYLFQLVIEIDSDTLGKIQITPPVQKGSVSGQVLLWDNNEAGRRVDVIYKTG